MIGNTSKGHGRSNSSDRINSMSPIMNGTIKTMNGGGIPADISKELEKRNIGQRWRCFLWNSLWWKSSYILLICLSTIWFLNPPFPVSPISSEKIATKDKTIILAIAMQIISGILLRQFPEDVLDLPDYQMITKETFMTDFLRVVEKVQVHIVTF